jgi:NAD(P)-dependent dehydrogenase (short-subunit alcohol dehydrogenase family)
MTAQNRLAGKVAIVTGSGAGIGRAEAIWFAAQGARATPVRKASRGQRQTGLITRAEFKAPPANPLFFPH